MGYPGGKNGAGVYQTLINRMPPHTTYIEPFLGSGALMRLKRPARVNIGIDRDPAVIDQWQARIITSVEGGSHHVKHGETAQISHRHSRRACSIVGDAEGRSAVVSAGETSGCIVSDAGRGSPLARSDDTAGSIVINGEQRSALASPGDGARFQFHVGDGITFLHSYPFTGTELVYCDPPYLPTSRRDPDVYRFEMDENQHRRFLDTIRALPCLVMVSGYWSPLYAERLVDWPSIQYQAMTRGGYAATEWLWCNYPPPVALHDYRYLGVNFRERERIKRKKSRWVQRLQRMPILERQAMLAAIEDAWA
jgi:DNA adenine methylase